MITQLLIYFLVYWPFRIVFDFKSDSREIAGIKYKERYLIVANHRTWLDVFLILASLPLSIFWKLLPVRIFVANVYLKRWWQRLIMLNIGSFPASYRPNKISGVSGGLEFSDKGQTLFIFPDGKRLELGQKPDLKPGLGRLIKSRAFIILPVRIDYDGRRGISIKWQAAIMPTADLRNRPEKFITELIFEKIVHD